jgi:hypothetical protein
MSSWRRSEGLSKLAQARSLAADGQTALAAGNSTAEQELRSAVDVHWSAMNWLEDDEGFDTAHDEIHGVGRVLRENFETGCSLGPRDDGSFAHTCPVFLSHKRFGMSVGMTGNSICSVCYEDASECPHIPGERYEIVASHEPWCNVCGEQNCPNHVVGTRYPSEMGIVITEAELHEVSIVSRPAQPDARIRTIPIDRTEVEAAIGQLPDGAYLRCDKCLGPCDGFDSFRDRDHSS